VLARAHRLTRGDDYRHVVRRGSRCAGAHTVTHVVVRSGEDVRFGFIVAKSVGNAVVRNTVRRRLKAACARLVGDVPPGRDIVIRALPGSAGADFSTLNAEVTRCVNRSRA
jgi:ribonuclease P protein component